MRTDAWTTLRSGLHWMLSLLTGGWLVSPPRSLLDTAPLRDLLAAAIPLERIPENIASGPLRAVAVATTSYSSGQAVAFFDGDRLRSRPGAGCVAPASVGPSISTC